MHFKVNKEKCLGCGACVVSCSEGMKIADDGKAEVIDQEQVKQCGGADVCPYGAIEQE